MATKLKHQQQDSQAGGNVVGLPSKCKAEGCGKRTEMMSFCSEHYEWFKWGMLTKEGKRPTDFDKKYQAFQSHKKKTA